MFGEDKKYLVLELDEQTVHTIKFTHAKKTLKVQKLVDPLDGNLLKVKVPFRYNRVMCTTKNKIIQELVKGDIVKVDIKYCGWWQSDEFGGPSWKLDSMEFLGSSPA
jgi:hypothetical protein